MAVMRSLTDRYVAAVLRHVDDGHRAELEQGLRTEIASLSAARMSQGVDAPQAERLALESLGDPIRVAAARGGRALALIGPAVYPEYVRLLRLLLVIVVPIITVLTGVGSAVAGESLPDSLGDAVSAGFSVGIQLAFWVTIVFTILDRRHVVIGPDWDLDDLPEPVDRRIGLGETIGGIVGLALLAWFLIWQPGYVATLGSTAAPIPILNPELSAAWIPYLVAVLAVSIAFELVKYWRGRWGVALAAVNTLLNAAFAIPVVWLLARGAVLNPEFESALPFDASALAFVPTLLAWGIAALAIIDAAQGWWKALR